MIDHTINDLVNEALLAWGELVKVPEPDADGVTRCSSRDDIENTKHLEALNNSRRQDSSGLTTFMLLRGLAEQLLKQTKISAYSLILDPASIETHLAPMKRLRDVLEHPAVIELISAFQTRLREAADHYQLTDQNSLGTLLDDKYELAAIRRDALHSIETLQAFQFVQGKPDPASLKYNKRVFEFWNVNSLLRALLAQRFSGISLILIRDPAEVFASYFVFAVRNGETITVLTDHEVGPHPAYWNMTRRPDRAFERRAARHRFPYELLDLKLSENQQHLFATARDQLVPYNSQGVPLKEIRELNADCFVWLVLMFDLIRDKYWTQNLLLPELAYTGEMILDPHALVGAAGALVKEGHYKPLNVVPYEPTDITAESTAPQWQQLPTGFNRWMVERYGAQGPNLMNTVGEATRVESEQRLEEFVGKLAVKDDHAFWSGDEQHALETLSPLAFGPESDLERDRQWVGRYNQMVPIQKLADAEYCEQEAHVLDWLVMKANANAELFLKAAVRGSLVLPHDRWRGTESFEPYYAPIRETVEGLKVGTGRTFHHAFPHRYAAHISFWLGNPAPRERARFSVPTRGYLRPARPTLWYLFSPTCPAAVAVLCGVTVDDLPIWLRHWYTTEPYTGNSILNRLDPEDWKLHNPWLDMRIVIGLALTKRGLADLKKRYR